METSPWAFLCFYPFEHFMLIVNSINSINQYVGTSSSSQNSELC